MDRNGRAIVCEIWKPNPENMAAKLEELGEEVILNVNKLLDVIRKFCFRITSN